MITIEFQESEDALVLCVFQNGHQIGRTEPLDYNQLLRQAAEFNLAASEIYVQAYKNEASSER